MSKALEIQVHRQAMLNGPVLMLRPVWALSVGGVAEGLVYQQLIFRAGGWDDDGHSVRFSYTKLQRQLPFFTRRWLIEIIKRLEAKGAISVGRGARVNTYTVIGKYDGHPEATDQNTAAMLVFPQLACKVGLMEAVALQQIHIRSHIYDGSSWVIRTFHQWQSEVFMFLGLATVKRLFAKLRNQGLIFVKPYHSENAIVNSYRVNYLRVAEVLGLPPPCVSPPKSGGGSNDWKNPLYPIEQPLQEFAVQ